MMKILFALFVLILFLAAGCAKQAVEEEEPGAAEEVKEAAAEEPECPDSCDDDDPCTEDSCSEETDYKCRHDKIEDCCGNDDCEDGEDYKNCPEDCEAPEMDPEILELIEKGQEQDNYYYTFYSSQNTFEYTAYVLGDKIKIVYETGNLQEDEGKKVDTAYIDRSEKTATLYCFDEDKCKENLGFIAEKAGLMDYNSYNIVTPVDKLDDIPDDAEKSSSVMVNNKASTPVIFTNFEGDEETIYISEYYGIPTKVEVMNEDEVISFVEYEELVIGQVKERDVTAED